MDLITALALAAFIALVAALAIVVARLRRLLAVSRADDAFRRGLAGITRRAEAQIATVLPALDAGRYGAPVPETLAETAGQAAAAMEALGAEVRALPAPADRVAGRDAVAAYIGRALEVLRAVAGGPARATAIPVSAAARRGATAERADAERPDADAERPDADAERPDADARRMSLKRDFLALVHARDAIATHAAKATVARPRPERGSGSPDRRRAG